MSSLTNSKPRPAAYEENGHDHALRDGNAYSFDAVLTALGVGAEAFIRFTTGDKAIIFEGGLIDTNQEEVLMEVYQDTTFTAPGAPNATYSRNMNNIIARATELVFYDAPTIDVIGERVLHQIAYGIAGQNVNQPGFGSGVADVSTVFKPNTEHVFRLKNDSILAVDIESHMFYREVNAKEYS